MRTSFREIRQILKDGRFISILKILLKYEKAKNLKRGDKILIPLESGIYCTKTPLCLAIAKLTNVTFSEKSAIFSK